MGERCEECAKREAEIARMTNRNTDLAHEMILARAVCDERDNTIDDLRAEIARLRDRVAQLEYDPCEDCEHGCCACMCFRKEENDKAIAEKKEEQK